MYICLIYTTTGQKGMLELMHKRLNLKPRKFIYIYIYVYSQIC